MFYNHVIAMIVHLFSVSKASELKHLKDLSFLACELYSSFKVNTWGQWNGRIKGLDTKPEFGPLEPTW